MILVLFLEKRLFVVVLTALLNGAERSDPDTHPNTQETRIAPGTMHSTKDEAESQSFPADSGQFLDAKRTAFEEPNTAPDAKRIKSFHDGLAKPNVNTQAVARRVPFPDKVR